MSHKSLLVFRFSKAVCTHSKFLQAFTCPAHLFVLYLIILVVQIIKLLIVCTVHTYIIDPIIGNGKYISRLF
jgi:hypothetical protein